MARRMRFSTKKRPKLPIVSDDIVKNDENIRSTRSRRNESDIDIEGISDSNFSQSVERPKRSKRGTRKDSDLKSEIESESPRATRTRKNNALTIQTSKPVESPLTPSKNNAANQATIIEDDNVVESPKSTPKKKGRPVGSSNRTFISSPLPDRSPSKRSRQPRVIMNIEEITPARKAVNNYNQFIISAINISNDKMMDLDSIFGFIRKKYNQEIRIDYNWKSQVLNCLTKSGLFKKFQFDNLKYWTFKNNDEKQFNKPASANIQSKTFKNPYDKYFYQQKLELDKKKSNVGRLTSPISSGVFSDLSFSSANPVYDPNYFHNLLFPGQNKFQISNIAEVSQLN